MSTCPAVSAQKSGDPTHARTSPVRLFSTTKAASRTPRSARVRTVCRTSASSAVCRGKSSEVRQVLCGASPPPPPPPPPQHPHLPPFDVLAQDRGAPPLR